MERRAFIAVVISIAILVFYQEVVLKRLYPPPPAALDVPGEPPSAAPRAETVPPPAIEAETAAPAPLPIVNDHPIEIDTDLYHATITATGARLTSFKLKRQRTSLAPDSPPLEMVRVTSGEYPLAVQLRGAKESLNDAALTYHADRDAVALHDGGEGTLTLTTTSADTTITKTFSFRDDSYLVGLDITVDGGATFSEIGVAWHKGIEAAALPGVEQLFDQISLLQDKKLLHEKFDALAAGKVIEKNIYWAGYDGRYFMAMMVPGDPAPARAWLKQRDHSVETMVLMPRAEARVATHMDVYVGPKDYNALKEVGHELDRAVDLGWFWFIAWPLLLAIKFSHRITGNYGIDIILLTVTIKILFIPLTQRSFKSMKAMQKLQPQMAKIRERYKDTPEEMNKEIMELYRRHKVNPLGGCLPMVLQMPVFLGLYAALSHAVELRHAPFFLWITDLSAPDRLGSLAIPFVSPPGIPVLTLLMGGSMFLQQWMTPSTGDPQQQRVMMIMPLMFTFMFVSFPAGLTLYWLVNNLLTIGQQYVINRPERRSE
ncbi:MAG: membrane protein insertase YidC [Deltaproteobacteria bacterium]|nr:membrane protein insertase YidC [Deltaproteobacteria bacterium]